MPDIINYSPTPLNIDVKDIDLSKALSQRPSTGLPLANDFRPTGSSSPFSIDTNQYQAPERLVDREDLNKVSGYNSFKETPNYNPDISSIDNIRDYAAKQGTGEWLKNSGIKLWDTTKNSFIGSFQQDFRNIAALKNLDFDKLISTDDNTAEQEALRNKYPTYGTGELDNSWKRFIPTNFGKSDFGGEMISQLGFTIGTMGAALAQNALIETATGGAGTALAAAKDAFAIGKIGKGFANLFEVASGVSNFKKGLSILETVKNESNLASTIGNATVKGLKGLANGYAMYSTAASEAGFEGNNAYTSHLNDLKDQYKQEHGYEAFGEDLKKIQDSAMSTGLTTFGWNLPILLASNLVQFGNILKPFKGAVADTLEDVAFKLEGKGLLSTIERVVPIESKLAKVFKRAEKYSLGFLGKESLSEGVEEISQSFVSTGADTYYKNLYKGLSQGSSLNNAAQAMWNYAGSKGFQDDFFGGYLGGALFNAGGHIAEMSGFKDTAIGKRITGGSEKSKEAAKEKQIEEFSQILKKVSTEDLAKWAYSPETQRYISQVANSQQMDNAVKKGDIFEYKDGQNNTIRDGLFYALQTGKLDLFLSKLDVLPMLDSEDINKFRDTNDKIDEAESKNKVLKLVDEVKDRAYKMQSDWNTLNQKYKNTYSPETTEYRAYEKALQDRLFAKDAVEQDRKRSDNLRNEVSSSSEAVVNNSVIDQAVDKDILNSQIKNLEIALDNTIDKTSPLYEAQKEQLPILKEISKEKAKTTADFEKIAELTIQLAESNTNGSKYFSNLSRDENKKKVKDVLQLEDRHQKNIAQYHFLNKQSLTQSMLQHIEAMRTVLTEAKKEDEKKKSVTKTQPTADVVLEALRKYKDVKSLVDAYNKLTPEQQTQYKEFFTQRKEELNKPKPITNNPAIETPDNEASKQLDEDTNTAKRKFLDIRYLTDTATPSEQLSTTNTKDPEYHRRKDFFLENLLLGRIQKDNKTPYSVDEVKAVVITSANVHLYSKDGDLNSLLTNKEVPDTAKAQKDWNTADIDLLDKASMLFVFGVEQNGKFFPVGTDGKLLEELSPASTYLDKKQLVYSFADSIDDTNYSNERSRNQAKTEFTEDEIKAAKKQAREQRYTWLKAKTLPSYNFNISNGLPNGKGLDFKLNSIENTQLVADNYTIKASDVYIPTEGEKSSNGQFQRVQIKGSTTDKFLVVGRPYFVVRDKEGNAVDYQWLENDKLTDNQKKVAYKLLSDIAKDYYTKGKKVINETNYPKLKFLKSILFFQEADLENTYRKEASITLQEEQDGLKLYYDFSKAPKSILLTENTSPEILEGTLSSWMDNRFFNVTKADDKKFDEYYLDSKGNAKFRTWDNYANYLLSKDTRKDEKEIPLKVNIYSQSQVKEAYEKNGENPTAYSTNYKQRYIVLKTGKQASDKGTIENKQPKKQPQAPAKKAPVKQAPKKQAPAKKAAPVEAVNKKGKSLTSPSDVVNLPKLSKTNVSTWLDFYNKQVKNVLKDNDEVNDFIDDNWESTGETYGELFTSMKLTEAQVKALAETILYKKYVEENPVAEIVEEVSKVVEQAPQPSELDNKITDIEKRREQELLKLEDFIPEEDQPERSHEEYEALEKEIDTKYDEELNNLKPATSTTNTSTISEEDLDLFSIDDINENVRTKEYQSTSQNYTKENVEAIKSFFKQNLPQVDLQFTDRLIKLANGSMAWGTFQNSLVKVYKEAISGTGYHEAFEVLFGGLLNNKEKSSLLKEFRSRKGQFSNFATKGSTDYSKATDNQAIEELSEEFMRYKLTGTLPKFEKTQNIFQRIWNFIKQFVFNIPSINKAFSNLDKGFYANRELKSSSEVRTKKLEGVGIIEEKQILEGLTVEFVDQMFKETKSFNSFDKIFDEKELYDTLKQKIHNFYTVKDKQGDTHLNMLLAKYGGELASIRNSKLTKELEKQKLLEVNKKALAEWEQKRDKWLNILQPQWEDVITQHKKFFKQIGIISTIDVNESEDQDENEKNSNEYTKNAFKIDLKASAPKSVRLLFNTLVEGFLDYSNFVTFQDGKFFLPNVVPNYTEATGMGLFVNNSNELFNATLSKLSGLNNLDLMKSEFEKWLGLDKFENSQDKDGIAKYISDRQQADAAYRNLIKIYTRIFYNRENNLSEDEIAQRLKVLNTFAKTRPRVYVQMISTEGESFFVDSTTESGRRKIGRDWLKAITSDVFQKDNKRGLFTKKAKNEPYKIDLSDSTGVGRLLKLRDNTDEFILGVARRLRINDKINKGFLSQLNTEEKNRLSNNFYRILEYGLKEVWNGEKGKKFFTLNPNRLGIAGPFNEITDLILTKTGDQIDSVHINIEGEQQQTTILNNSSTILLAEANNAKNKEAFLTDNPEYNDIYAQDSQILNEIIFDRKGNKTGRKVSIDIIDGTKDLTRDSGKKSSKHDVSERLFQEFNANLEKKFYLLVPADSETESIINYDQHFVDFTNNRDMLLQKSIDQLKKYLSTEIQVALDFNKGGLKSQNENLQKKRKPKPNLEERKVGSSLQLFKDILSDETVQSIHEYIDTPAGDIQDLLDSIDEDINNDIEEFLDKRVQNTFEELNSDSSYIVTRQDDFEKIENLQLDKDYIFHGLNSNFAQTHKINRLLKKSNKEDEGLTEQPGAYSLSGEELSNLILFREINYITSNIEITKVFFGNPSFFKDILKRIKSFLSPKETSFVQKGNDQHKFNEWFTKNKNNVSEDHPHFHTFKNYLNTLVFKDHNTYNALANYNKNNATDAQSLALPNAYREFAWKNGARFDEKMEKQFQLEQAFERFLLDKDGIVPYNSSKDDNLQKQDLEVLEDNIKRTKDEDGKYQYELTKNYAVFPIIKPLGSGFLHENEQIPFIWKTSVAMTNYRMVRGTAFQNAYLHSLKSKNDIITFESTFKVGLQTNKEGQVENLVDIDNFDNLGNTKEDYNSFTHKIPFKTTGYQQETSTQKDKGTIGSQTTKLIITDLFNYGIPSDFMKDSDNYEEVSNAWNNLSEEQKLQTSQHYALEKEHRQAIEDLETVGYYDLLDRFGISEVKDDNNTVTDFHYEDLQKTYDLLRDEMMRRGMSPNVYELLEDPNIKVKPLEALTNYEQASFIIMSLVRKQIVKSKLNGGQKIQMSSAFLNDVKKEGLKAMYKDGKEYKQVTTEEEFKALTPEQRKTITFSSEQLKFYRKGENGETLPMEIMISSSIKNKINKQREARKLKALTDSELLDYLNKNQHQLLEGIGFRIPTQALSSIETFLIKGFLPDYMGDAVAVPSELTTKAGSDFDVDKLSTYLYNWKLNGEGYPEMVKLPQTEDEFKEVYKKTYFKKSNLLKYIQNSYESFIREDRPSDLFLNEIFQDHTWEIEDFADEFLEGFPDDYSYADLTRDAINETKNAPSFEEFMKLPIQVRQGKKALENKYFRTIDKILKLERNFDKMLSPNSSDEFQGENAIRDKILKATGLFQEKAGGYLNYSEILDSSRMRYMRWAFVAGKQGVAIAAIAATNHINSQKIGFKVNTPINFKHNKVKLGENEVSVLSGITKEGGTHNISEFVSKYVNGYVDIAKDTWILEMGATLDVAGVFLLMERMGIDSETIVNFMNQPVVKFYLKMKALRNSPIRRINKDLNTLLTDFRGDSLDKYIKNILTANIQTSEIKEFSLSELKKYIEQGHEGSKPKVFSDFIKEVDNTGKNYQYQVFEQLKRLEAVSDYIRASQQASNFDTANLNSLTVVDDKKEQLAKLYAKEALVTTIKDDRLMAEALIDDTFVSNIVGKISNLDTHFLSKHLFRIQREDLRQDLRNLMNELNPSIYSESDRRSFMTKLTKTVINIVLHNSDNIKSNPYVQDLQSYMKRANLQAVLDKYTKVAEETTSQDLLNLKNNRWIQNLRVEAIDEENNEFGYFTLANNKPKAGSYEEFQWIGDLKTLYNHANTRALAVLIINAAIMQNGVEFNKNTFSELIPYQYFYPIVDKALDNLSMMKTMNLKRLVAQMKAYDIDYVPKLAYLPYKKTPQGYKNTKELSFETQTDGSFVLKSQSNKKSNKNTEVFVSPSTDLTIRNTFELPIQAINLIESGEKTAIALLKPNVYKVGDVIKFKEKEGKKDVIAKVTSIATKTIGQKIKADPEYIKEWSEKQQLPIEFLKANAKTALPSYEVEFETIENPKQINKAFAVPSDAYNANLPYFTLEQPSSLYSPKDIKEMKKNQNYSYKTRILFEKAPFKVTILGIEHNIFVPLNRKGHQYLQETIDDNNYSLFNTNEMVNPKLGDYDILKQAILNSPYNKDGAIARLEDETKVENQENDNSENEITLSENPFMIGKVIENKQIIETNTIVKSEGLPEIDICK